MPDEPASRRPTWAVVLLVLLPLWLVVSTLGGLWMWKRQQEGEAAEPTKFASEIDAGRLSSDVEKLVKFAGRRGIGSDDGARGLTRAAAMIEGSLGPSNAGYRIERLPGPPTGRGEWPLIVAKLRGAGEGKLWVVAAYDTLSGGVEANSTGVASVVSVAGAIAEENPLRTVAFAFLPHVHDPEAPVMQVLDRLRGQLGEGDLVLVVEAMGAGDELMVSSRDLEALGSSAFSRHGTIVGAEAVCLEDDKDLASVLFEMGVPAIRVAARRVVGVAESDTAMPDPEAHAESTRALAEMVSELAGG